MVDQFQRPDLLVQRGKSRWHAMVVHRSLAGPVDTHFDINEIQEVHDLIERGPNWNTIVRIEIALNWPLVGELTVEEAATL